MIGHLFLPLTKFAYNNTIHVSNQHTPFYFNYGHYLRFDLLCLCKSYNPTTNELTRQLSQLQETMKLQLQKTHHCYKASTNKHKKKQPSFQVSDKV